MIVPDHLLLHIHQTCHAPTQGFVIDLLIDLLICQSSAGEGLPCHHAKINFTCITSCSSSNNTTCIIAALSQARENNTSDPHTYLDNGLFQKKSTPPQRMGSFFNPPSHLDFLKPKTPPPVWISKTKDPSSCLDFREKILGLNLIYF